MIQLLIWPTWISPVCGSYEKYLHWIFFNSQETNFHRKLTMKNAKEFCRCSFCRCSCLFEARSITNDNCFPFFTLSLRSSVRITQFYLSVSILCSRSLYGCTFNTKVSVTTCVSFAPNGLVCHYEYRLFALTSAECVLIATLLLVLLFFYSFSLPIVLDFPIAHLLRNEIWMTLNKCFCLCRAVPRSSNSNHSSNKVIINCFEHFFFSKTAETAAPNDSSKNFWNSFKIVITQTNTFHELCVKCSIGSHFIGGRFVSSPIISNFQFPRIELPWTLRLFIVFIFHSILIYA